MQQNERLLVILLLVLHGAGQRTNFFQLFFFAFFGRDLVDLLLLHFKQFAPFAKPSLTLKQGRALGRIGLKARKQVVPLVQKLWAAQAAFQQFGLK